MAAERRAYRALTGARLAVALALVPLSACFAPTTPGESPGYDPALPSGELYRWALGRTVRVHAVPSDPASDEALLAATRLAAERWSAALYYRELTIVLVRESRDADIIVRPAQAASLVGTAGCEPPTAEPAGSTFFCRARLPDPQQDTALTLPLQSGAPGRVKVEIMVDPSQALTAGHLEALVAHELGHALGIGAHSADPRDLMYAAPSVSRPSARDASTLRWLLHQRADVRL